MLGSVLSSGSVTGRFRAGVCFGEVGPVSVVASPTFWKAKTRYIAVDRTRYLAQGHPNIQHSVQFVSDLS